MQSQNKENFPRLLTKQGVFYQISLGKNNGPFLSKDIMHSNPKSISLLTGTEILRFHTSMVNTLHLFQDKSTTKSSLGVKTPQVENFNSTFKYLQGELQALNKNSISLKNQERKLRKQLQEFQEKINVRNNDILQESTPILKNLMKIVKQNGSREKAQLCKMARQLSIISQYREDINLGVRQCNQKISKIESSFGSAKNNTDLYSPDSY